MKTIAVMLLLALFSGCDAPRDETITAYPDDKMHTIEYDGCEYVVWRARNTSYAGSITHKGNCKNPIHARKQTGEAK